LSGRALRGLAERFPSLATAVWVYRRLRRSRTIFAQAGGDSRPLEELVTENAGLLALTLGGVSDLRLEEAPVVASQKWEELLPLLERIRALRPRRVCEIGTSAAGTLYLLTRVSAPDAVIVSIDISVPLHARALRSKFGLDRQTVVSIEGDSHSEVTKRELERALGGDPLDVLFIDGDHSYDGVRADFELYRELVRPGGLIALHDVNEDFRTRRGIKSPSISGEVPRFWQEVKSAYRTEELIADPEQDGFGIGVIYL
jgi:predicted O-methyltransferase YrrM